MAPGIEMGAAVVLDAATVGISIATQGAAVGAQKECPPFYFFYFLLFSFFLLVVSD